MPSRERFRKKYMEKSQIDILIGLVVLLLLQWELVKKLGK